MECGFGAYCDRATAKCVPAKAEGAVCETAFECQSIKCESSGSGGEKKCQPPKPIVDAEDCK